MNRQQILDAIDAEIKAVEAVRAEMQSMEMKMSYDNYIDGLKFARDLVEKSEGGA